MNYSTDQRRADLLHAAAWLSGERGAAPPAELMRLAEVLRGMADACNPMSENEAVVEYIMLHYTPHGGCCLCGNSGVLDTRGVRSAAGAVWGDVVHCLCPNGQRYRELGIDAAAHVLRGERRGEVRTVQGPPAAYNGPLRGEGGRGHG